MFHNENPDFASLALLICTFKDTVCLFALIVYF